MSTQVTVITGSGSTAYTVNLDRRGPQGIQGEQGEKGDQGVQGEVGPPGPTDYNLLTNVPATFPPSAHTHVVSNITPVSGTHLIGRHAGGSGDAQEVSVGNGVEFSGGGIRRSALTGDVTASAGSNATTIANDAVTNAKLANMATATIKGRTTAGTGDPEDLTPAQARTVIGVSPALVVSDTAPTTPVDGQQWLGLTSEILFVWSATKNKWIVADANFDSDAAFYINSVEVADTQSLEIGVRNAINNFVYGCKQDGIWDSIKASCILAGARTLTGALVPLKGAAPTNFNFVSGDYNRVTGLVGDGSTKYLNSNRNNNADPQDNQHMAVYASTVQGSGTFAAYIGSRFSGATENTFIGRSGSFPDKIISSNKTASAAQTSTANIGASVGFVGMSRSSSANYITRAGATNETLTQVSSAPLANSIGVFTRLPEQSATTNARLAFYSIGESLDLDLLDTRVTALINAIDAAI
jgi:hypothetical protein